VVSEETFVCSLTVTQPSGLSFIILEMWSA
jgi:hypothetical protein